MGHYTWYRSTTRGHDDALKAIEGKIGSLRQEIKFFEQGLEKVSGLHEKQYYEIHHKLVYPTRTIEFDMFVQCHDIGRDHVRFDVLASTTVEDLPSKSITETGSWSASWGNEWTYKPADPMEVAIKYVACPYKSTKFAKLFKKGFSNV